MLAETCLFYISTEVLSAIIPVNHLTMFRIHLSLNLENRLYSFSDYFRRCNSTICQTSVKTTVT